MDDDRSWPRIMPLVAYIDDSGSEPSAPVFALAGFVLPESWWHRVSEDWVPTLHSHPRIDYFKASEVWDRTKGPFAAFSDDQRRRKVDALVEVAMEYQPFGISCRVSWAEFNLFLKENPVHPLAHNPYFFLFYGIIMSLISVQHVEKRFEKVQFVFDEHGRIGKSAQSFYGYFKQQSTPEARSLLGDAPRFADEKAEYPLQCADLFAWYTRRRDVGLPQNEWHENVWTRLSKNYISKAMDHKTLRAMAWDLGAIP